MEYHRILEQRKSEAELRQKEYERRKALADDYQSTKKKMDKALKRKTRKGQPKLNAQVAVLLEKIQKRVSK